MQVSPSGMAAASQAVPGEFDSRHLLQKRKGAAGALSLLVFNRKESRTPRDAKPFSRERIFQDYHNLIFDIRFCAEYNIENGKAKRKNFQSEKG